MTTAGQENKSKSFVHVAGCLGVIATFIAILVFGITQLRRQAVLSLERTREEYRQSSFDRVKQGDSSALVMDSKLLPMLARDADCRRIVTRLTFAETKIDPSDAKYVAELSNVTSMTLYCTTGTKELLLAARPLPITDLYFEGSDLPLESFYILKDFPQLKKVHFAQEMDDEWIDFLQSELPNVTVDAPFPQSKEPGATK